MRAIRSLIWPWTSVISVTSRGERAASATPMWKRMSARRYCSKSVAPAIRSTSASRAARSAGSARSAASIAEPTSIATRWSRTAQASPPSGSSSRSARGGRSATKVPPVRPRIEFRCPDWTRVVIACRSVEREIRSSPASSRSGGSLLPGASSPMRIAVPSRSTVSSKVVGGRTGLNTASSAASRFTGLR